MSAPDAGQAPALSIPLQHDERLDLWPGRLAVGEESYPLADLTWVGLVAAPPLAAAPGAAPTPPIPAVALRLRDERAPVFVPANGMDAWKLCDAIFAQRPDLRTPLPPPVGAGWGAGAAPPPPPGYGPGFAPGYMPPYGAYYGAAGGMPPFPPPRSNNNETLLAGISHLSIFFAPVILPLIVWLVTQNNSPYASRQAKQAFFFHLIMSGITVLIVLPAYFLFFISIFNTTSYVVSSQSDPLFAGSFGLFFLAILVVFAINIVNMVFSILGAVNGFQGKPFHYPLLGRI